MPPSSLRGLNTGGFACPKPNQESEIRSLRARTNCSHSLAVGEHDPTPATIWKGPVRLCVLAVPTVIEQLGGNVTRPLERLEKARSWIENMEIWVEREERSVIVKPAMTEGVKDLSCLFGKTKVADSQVSEGKEAEILYPASSRPQAVVPCSIEFLKRKPGSRGGYGWFSDLARQQDSVSVGQMPTRFRVDGALQVSNVANRRLCGILWWGEEVCQNGRARIIFTVSILDDAREKTDT
ncbi:hypothetical protein BJ322DRAFT_1025310 [Thelephora terrestris]|uniref:Uncharacterized protein n=1 Tax=Thelephora terrestris TaxID=56493 RepID=A0A9P6L1I7_9AGAM|nr:hypothetical protein BJ322DRAFT_1025310 [Thelephora terrestris]